MGSYSLPLYHKQKHSATKAGSITTACVIYAVLVHADGAQADVDLIDAATDTGADDLEFSQTDGDSQLFDFTGLGGVAFATGLSITLAGTGASVTIWTDKAQLTA